MKSIYTPPNPKICAIILTVMFSVIIIRPFIYSNYIIRQIYLNFKPNTAQYKSKISLFYNPYTQYTWTHLISLGISTFDLSSPFLYFKIIIVYINVIYLCIFVVLAYFNSRFIFVRIYRLI